MDLSGRRSLYPSGRNPCGKAQIRVFSEGMADSEWLESLERLLIQRLSPTPHSSQRKALQWKVLLPLRAQFLLSLPAFLKNLSFQLKGNTGLLCKSSMSSHKMTFLKNKSLKIFYIYLIFLHFAYQAQLPLLLIPPPPPHPNPHPLLIGVKVSFGESP